MEGEVVYGQYRPYIRHLVVHSSPPGEVPVLVALFVQLHTVAIKFGLDKEGLVFHEPQHLGVT